MKFINVFLILGGTCIGLLMAELILRLVVPADLLLPHSQEIFATKDRVSIYNNINGEPNYSPKLDSVIIHTKNKLGLRGPNLTGSSNELVKILCIGGSTTECQYLTDGKDWPALLSGKLDSTYPNKYWLNNAGVDGHSTFGHIKVLETVVDSIKPTFIFFLVGCNDIGRYDLSNYDINQPASARFYLRFPVFLSEHSYIFKLLEKVHYEVFQRRLRKKYNIQHQTINLLTSGPLKTDPADSAATMEEHRRKYIPPYGARLQKIIDLCNEKNIRPIFITQPTLVGALKDPTTGVNLNTIYFSENLDGASYWQLLELYNDETRDIARKNNIPIIDLAHEMPKDSKFYYDFIHYTNEGARIVAQIIFNETETHKLLDTVEDQHKFR